MYVDIEPHELGEDIVSYGTTQREIRVIDKVRDRQCGFSPQDRAACSARLDTRHLRSEWLRSQMCRRLRGYDRTDELLASFVRLRRAIPRTPSVLPLEQFGRGCRTVDRA